MADTSFDNLLRAAHAQPGPQHLLFVCALGTLPDGATPAQRARFGSVQGNAPHELDSFAALARETAPFDPGEWHTVSAAALPGGLQHAPASAGAEAPRQARAMRAGRHGNRIPFNRLGEPVQLD